MKQFFIYFMTNPNKTVLYIGVTSNLVQRVSQHREKTIDGFSKRYNTIHLIYYEEQSSAEHAILREKQVKKWRRDKKEMLINTMNPNWNDLFPSLF